MSSVDQYRKHFEENSMLFLLNLFMFVITIWFWLFNNEPSLMSPFAAWLKYFFFKKNRFYGRKRKQTKTDILFFRFKSKPEWVKNEILRLKALMPDFGCRKIADIFNRLYQKERGVTVGKTYVNTVIRDNLYELQVLQNNLKNKKPKLVPQDLVWGLDLTVKTDSSGKQKFILRVLEHATRGCLFLECLKSKSSKEILMALFNTIQKSGYPKFIRTDNEGIFTSKVFRLALICLGIKHQRIDKACPWQNGRIERFFGTLKERLNLWEVDNHQQLNKALGQFRFWYHFVRPHNNLEGRTPGEVWNENDVFNTPTKERYWFEGWEGLLTGYLLL